jgi:signal transduction histidine kinase
MEIRMQQAGDISAQKWVWRAMVRSALVPLVLVETVLIAVYLISNNMIREANINYIYQQADKELQLSAQRESEVVREQLLAISRQTDIYRAETERVLTDKNIITENINTDNYGTSPQGVFYSKKNMGGAASFYSSVTPIDKQDHEKVWRLSRLDSLMQQIKETNPLIAATYFNSWDSYNHIYPWFNTLEQYPKDMKIPEYNFYYLADKKNNPLRSVVWTDVYIDPAGNGWMASCIAPVYRQDFLEGVVGLDITVGAIIEKIQGLVIPWGGYAMLVNSNGNIMALPPEGEQDFGLRELTNHSYQEAIKKEIFKPEQFNLFLRKDSQPIVFDIKNSLNGKGFLTLNGKKKLIAWDSIPETRWKLITIVDENQVYSETRTLAQQFTQIGYLMIAGLVLFYIVFIFFIWLSSRRMSQAISQPLLHMKTMVDLISHEEYQLDKPAFTIAELQETALAVVSMGQKLDTITCDLRRAKEEADAANKAKGLFLSSMSHELRTPLNAILGFGQLLQKDNDDLSSRDRQDYIDEIMTAGDHLLKLIDDVLNLSHIETKGASLKIELIDAIKICSECNEMLRAIAAKEQLTLSAELPTAPIMVMADSTRLRQIVINLISNAIKYNHPNGIIKIMAEIESTHLKISVQDNGNGIPENKQQDLFKPFNRLGHETSGIKGTGIGLSISKQLIESMHGQIGFVSQQNAGSTFWIKLWLADSEDSLLSVNDDEINIENSDTVEDEFDATAAHKLLCIGCDPLSIRQLAQYAKEYQFVITSAASQEDALILLDSFVPDVILLDTILINMNTYELLYQLRHMDNLKSIPIIAFTDEIMSVLQQSSENLYFDYVLIKPLDVHHSWVVIHKMLNYVP